MIINKIYIKNFKAYAEIEIPLQEGFNLIIGDNGSGKTSILEALTISMGAFLTGIHDIKSRSFKVSDVHIKSFDDHQEYAIPVIIRSEGVINSKELEWDRVKKTAKSTTSGGKVIKDIAKNIDHQVRNGANINLPLLAYFATGRLFDTADDPKGIARKREIASRFRAYQNCLESKSTFESFIKWFRGKELAKIQKGVADINYVVVKNAIINNIPDCENIYYEFDPDKSEGLKVMLKDGRTLPFSYLSDGTRNFLALIADIAFKCVTLNPHLKDEALNQTTGIVLIDELDLHLHPDWQKLIIDGLKSSFPKIQFVCTTHSPFLIQETEVNQLIKLKESRIEKIGSANNLSIEDIAEEYQDLDNPQWSKKRQHMFEVAKRYYQAVKDGNDTPTLKEEFDKAMKPFANDTALYAMIEQEKIKAEYLKSHNK
ncbi:MAG: AAA family ATPase [Marinifilaceae bacterium]|jgi:predicted ATP-binding protein involved in virulence|nr:AAA family ATPase [Marinifilaceae bacterium]